MFFVIFLSGFGLKAQEPYVIMLSMDGFRWDYPEKVPTPWLDSIQRMGVRAQAMIPAFPSSTFPNHYSMATGLYPDNHGIVMNNFFCPELNATYRISDRNAVGNPNFYGGEPIWVTARKQGLMTASYFWVGSEAPIKGMHPDYWHPFDSKVPFTNRIDTVVAWLQLPEIKRPRLITFYFEEPDAIAHNHGPDSPQTEAEIIRLDSLLGVFLSKINQLPIIDQLNVIVTSDHGMGATSSERYINLGAHLKRHWTNKSHGGNPVFIVSVKPEYRDSVEIALSKIDNLKFWWKEDLPAHLNYGKNPRVPDLTILADSAWSLGWNPPRNSEYSGGAHGYDPSNKDMHSIFYAFGPAFKTNYVHTPLQVVDLYLIISRILGLKPEKTDGSPERIEGIFRK